eukprot:420147_1
MRKLNFHGNSKPVPRWQYGIDWCTTNAHIQQDLNNVTSLCSIITSIQKDTKMQNFREESKLFDSMHNAISNIIRHGGVNLLVTFLHINGLDPLGRIIWCVEEEYHVQWYKNYMGLTLANEFNIDIATNVVVDDVINSMYIRNVFSASVNSLKNNKLIQQLNKNIKLNTPKNDNNSPPLNMDTNKIPKLLMEDDFEVEFKHSQANNDQLHQKTSLGQKDAELNNTLNMDTNKIPLKLNNNNS